MIFKRIFNKLNCYSLVAVCSFVTITISNVHAAPTLSLFDTLKPSHKLSSKANRAIPIQNDFTQLKFHERKSFLHLLKRGNEEEEQGDQKKKECGQKKQKYTKKNKEIKKENVIIKKPINDMKNYVHIDNKESNENKAGKTDDHSPPPQKDEDDDNKEQNDKTLPIPRRQPLFQVESHPLQEEEQKKQEQQSVNKLPIPRRQPLFQVQARETDKSGFVNTTSAPLTYIL